MKNTINLLTEVGEIKLTYNITQTLREKITVYGVTVTAEDESGIYESTTVDDITSDRTEIETLIELLFLGQVTPVSLHDVIDDFIS